MFCIRRRCYYEKLTFLSSCVTILIIIFFYDNNKCLSLRLVMIEMGATKLSIGRDDGSEILPSLSLSPSACFGLQQVKCQKQAKQLDS